MGVCSNLCQICSNLAAAYGGPALREAAGEYGWTVTAEAMARGALSHSRATIALAITGVAGPSGVTVRNPVGTVCFAWANRRRSAGSKLESLHNRLWEDITCESVRLWFNGGREEVRRQAVRTALEGALKCSRS